MFTGQSDKLARNWEQFHDPNRQQRAANHQDKYPLAVPPEPPPRRQPILDQGRNRRRRRIHQPVPMLDHRYTISFQLSNRNDI